MTDRPLFVPLRTEHYRAFERGEKRIEYRPLGARWNERTCQPGRAVTLSHGYSGARIAATVRALSLALAVDIPAALAIYPPETVLLAIELELSCDERAS